MGDGGTTPSLNLVYILAKVFNYIAQVPFSRTDVVGAFPTLLFIVVLAIALATAALFFLAIYLSVLLAQTERDVFSKLAGKEYDELVAQGVISSGGTSTSAPKFEVRGAAPTRGDVPANLPGLPGAMSDNVPQEVMSAALVPERAPSRWENITILASSDNDSDWRRAIIEADIMLEDVLSQRGIPGANIGERLRNANPNTFTTLDLAWEAHKVRNAIAHLGDAFPLEEREAHQTIALYRQVFEEFREI